MKTWVAVGVAAFVLACGMGNADAQYFGPPPPPPPMFLPPPGSFGPSMMPPPLGGRCSTPYGVCFMNGAGPLQSPCYCPSMNGPIGGVVIP